MGNTNVNAASGNQPVAPKGNQKPKKIGLSDWARSIFNSQFSKIDKNGNGVIDNGTEARQFIDWYTSMRDTAITYLQNKFNKNELYLNVSKNIHEAVEKVVKIWAELSIKHYSDAVKLKDSPDEKSSGKAQKSKGKTAQAKDYEMGAFQSTVKERGSDQGLVQTSLHRASKQQREQYTKAMQQAVHHDLAQDLEVVAPELADKYRKK